MDVMDWLLDSDPAIRWQVMRDLTDESAEAVDLERAKVTTDGWGARLLGLQAPDGQWGGGTYFPQWTATTPTLTLLRIFGLDPESEEASRAIALVRDNSRWDHDGQRYFEGEVEPCINGSAVAIGAYFGQDVTGIVDRLLTEQMDDGGWNCEQENGSTRGSFDTTINVLEGLFEYEQARHPVAAVTEARVRGQEYLLDRRLFRRQSTGEVIEPAYTHFFFPTRWHYDVLRGLDYLRNVGVKLDERAAEAIELVGSRRDADGRWEMKYLYPGSVHFDLDEGVDKPSRWNTLRALRVLKWAGAAV